MAKKKKQTKKTVSRPISRATSKKPFLKKSSTPKRATPSSGARKKPSAYKGTKLTKYQYNKAKKEYKAAYMRQYRRVQKVKDLDKGTKGYKSKKSKIFAEIIDINKELRHTAKRLKIKRPTTPKPKFRKPVQDIESKTITYTERIWEFEGILRSYIQSGAFKTIVNVNTGDSFKVTKSRETAIMFSFDRSKDIVYSKVGATTPFVEVTEDYGNSILTFEALS